MALGPTAVRCRVLSIEPLRCDLDPDLPEYANALVTVDFTDALLIDLGPALLMLYASFAGPPITRNALVELTQPLVSIEVDAATRAELLERARADYSTVLERGRERIADL